jgi:hypothetical protein
MRRDLMDKDQELFDLCKQVYEATGWNYNYSDFMSMHHIYSFEGKTTGSYWEDVYDDYRNRDPFDGRRPTGITHRLESLAPLYTSDYLLEKLPRQIMGKSLEIYGFDEETGMYLVRYDVMDLVPSNQGWYGARADTPLKALLLLTLALHKEGLLS